MPLSSFFALLFLLFYFWYMTSPVNSFHLTIPPDTPLDAPPPAQPFRLRARGPNFKISIGTKYVWNDIIPEFYNVMSDKFVFLDACHKKLNGTLVPATGPDLHKYVQQDKLLAETFPFEQDASLTVQDKNPFYFSCKYSLIHQLHMCPPGQFFHHSACQIIDKCVGQKDGKTFVDPYDTTRYYECHQEQMHSKPCPPGQYFLYNKCFDPHLMGLYCYALEKPKILDFKTLVVCREGQLTYEVCPPGFRYFDTPTCEPEACMGQPDGSLVPLPPQQMGPLSFSPGYMTCFQDKVVTTTQCPQEWDYYLSKGDNLTHLPQVFDGHKCTIPEFCVNVTSSDPDVVVPVHEFTKHVRNWIYSDVFDRVSGYQCVGSSRKRVALDPGTIIYSKRFKAQSACDGNAEKIVIPTHHREYFDCQTHSVQTCPANEFFDGYVCKPSMPHSFKYGQLELFQMDSLREDNWMIPWDYGKLPAVTPCNYPESEYLETYNVCSHPDCVLYPWLSQIPYQAFKVAHTDGSLCAFDDSTRSLKKEQTEDRYLYWAQRQVPREDLNESCVPGQNIQSGHFVFDQILFATCDVKQPFVFCPSSSTKGIKLIHGRSGTSYWACIPPGMKGIIPPQTTVQFKKNEVLKLLPVNNSITNVVINQTNQRILSIGWLPQDKFTLQTLSEPVEVEYEYRVSHPPEVVWPENASSFPGAFLTKAKDFTRKPVEIHQYGIKDSVSSFTLL